MSLRGCAVSSQVSVQIGSGPDPWPMWLLFTPIFVFVLCCVFEVGVTVLLSGLELREIFCLCFSSAGIQVVCLPPELHPQLWSRIGHPYFTDTQNLPMALELSQARISWLSHWFHSLASSLRRF